MPPRPSPKPSPDPSGEPCCMWPDSVQQSLPDLRRNLPNLLRTLVELHPAPAPVQTKTQAPMFWAEDPIILRCWGKGLRIIVPTTSSLSPLWSCWIHSTRWPRHKARFTHCFLDDDQMAWLKQLGDEGWELEQKNGWRELKQPHLDSTVQPAAHRPRQHILGSAAGGVAP